jgi:hypothetical protein
LRIRRCGGGGRQETGTVLWTSNCQELQVAFIAIVHDLSRKKERNIFGGRGNGIIYIHIYRGKDRLCVLVVRINEELLERKVAAPV